MGAAWLSAAMTLSAVGVLAQTPGAAGGMDEREQAFVEALRRENPDEASRYVALRDARNQAIDDVKKAQARYSAGGPELRPMFVQQMRDAQRVYAERSLALLDFLDARERRALDAGATSIEPPALQPYGERRAAVRDAFENQWYLAAPAA